MMGGNYTNKGVLSMFKPLVGKFIVMVVVLCLVFLGLSYYFKHVLDFREKLTAVTVQETKVHQIHSVDYAHIPTIYRNAVIATEDRRFWWDPGIDPVGILRSLFVDVGRDGYVQGGSTITQQVVDNTLIQRQKSLTYKAKQIFYALGIYDTFNKQEAFTMYANMIYFGHGAYGLYNAAETYFGRPPSELNSGELTMLAGIPNAPSVYDPYLHFALTRQRQSIVLENMVDAGLISQQESAAILKEPVRLVKSS
jgi:monofunctional glycosyltransferase